MRFIKDPFVQFLAIGALIFVVYGFSRSAERAGAERLIDVDRPTQDWIYSNFKKQFRRSPTRLEMGALIKAYIEHEVKYREALEMGLDDRDSIVRRRMMQKFDFLFGNSGADLSPEERVLTDWHEANSEEFTRPAAVSFTHVWFSPDKRGAAAEADAAEALEAAPFGAEPVGDNFPFDVAFEAATPAEVRNVLGVEFAESIFEAPLDVWSGPIKSGLGYHLVRVTRNEPPELQPFDEVREAVLQHWREAESKRLLAEKLNALMSAYEVRIEQETLEDFDYTPGEGIAAP